MQYCEMRYKKWQMVIHVELQQIFPGYTLENACFLNFLARHKIWHMLLGRSLTWYTRQKIRSDLKIHAFPAGSRFESIHES
jgi:hypothetical protein